MSTEFVMALCALICVVILSLDLGIIRGRVTYLEHELKKEVELLDNYNRVQENLIANLIKRIDQNSESCSQVNDLGIEIRVCQKDVEHALEMIEELKAKRSMDILDELRKEGEE
jgi:hypothetical protein